MSTITKDRKVSDMTAGELQELIQDTMKEELLKIQVSQTPYVSDKEMRDIEKSLTDEDLDNNDFVDMGEWLGR